MKKYFLKNGLFSVSHIFIRNGNKIMEINNDVTTAIAVERTPDSINLNGINIERNLCFINSYRIAKQNQGVEIVEGIALVVDTQNRAIPLAHVWNRVNGVYFDATYESIAEGTQEGIEAASETSEIRYFWVKVYDSSHFKNGDTFEFSSETKENIEDINRVLQRQ